MYNGLYGPLLDLRHLTLVRLIAEKDASYTRLRALCTMSGDWAYLDAMIELEIDTFKAFKNEIINRENGAEQLPLFEDEPNATR